MEISSESTTSEDHLDRSSNVPLLHHLATLKLRHLHRVMGCNIVPPPGHPPPQPPLCLPARISKQPLQSGYFVSLHASYAPDCLPFLSTELIASSCPLWNNLNLLSAVSHSIQTSKGLVARVWYKPAAQKCSADQEKPKTSDAEGSRPLAGSGVDSSVLDSESGHSRVNSNSSPIVSPSLEGDQNANQDEVTSESSECSGKNQKVCPPIPCEAKHNQTTDDAVSNRVSGSGNCDNNLKSSQQNNFRVGVNSKSSNNSSTSRNSYKVSSRSSRSSPQAINTTSSNLPSSSGSLVPPEPKSFKSKGNHQEGDTESPPAVLVFSWAIRLSGLVPVGTSVSQAAPGLAPNSLLFQMTDDDMLYTAADCIQRTGGPTSAVPAAGVEDLNMRRLWYGIRLPMSQTKRSYSPALLTKLHQNERDVVILERKCQDRRDRLHYMSSSLVNDSEHRLLRDKVAATQTRLSVARAVAERERKRLDGLKGNLEELEEHNQEKGMHLMGLLQQLSRDRQQLRATCSQTERHMQDLQRTRALLAHRRSCLVRDLAQVYPIVQISPKDDFSISNLWIPDAKFYNQSNLKTPTFQPTPSHRTKSTKSSSNSLRGSASSGTLLTKGASSQILPDHANNPSALHLDASSQQSFGSSLSVVRSTGSNLSVNDQSHLFSRSLPPSSASLGLATPLSSSPSSLSSTPRSTMSLVPEQNQVPSSNFSSVRANPSNVVGVSHARSPLYSPFHPYPDTVYAPVSSVALPHNNESLSAGLGMAAHLLCLVSGLLQVPLRYPVSPAGSMATITDVASAQLSQDNRKFPLYTRGKEREKLHFNYALFLLNKNIAQLHHYLGRPKPSSLPSLLHNLYTAVIHLSRPERPLTESLPDLRCYPLLTPNSTLWSDPLLPVLPSVPPPSPSLSPSNSLSSILASNDINQKPSGRGNGIPIPPSSSAAMLLRSPQKVRGSRHYRSHSHSLSRSPKHSSFSKSPSPSHSGATDHLHKSDSVSARSGFNYGGTTSPPLPPGGYDMPTSSSLGDLVSSCGPDELKERIGTLARREGKVLERSQGYVPTRNMQDRHAGRSPLRSLNRSVADSSQVSCSLDKGLDHIKDVVNNSKDIEIFVAKDSGLISNEDANKDTYVEKAVRPKPILKANTGSLSNLTKDKSLIVVSDSIEFEDPSLARYEDQTTCLLRSWHEDNTASYTGNFATCGSTEQLEEVGVEATEGFMKESEETGSVKFDLGACDDPSDDDSVSPPQRPNPPQVSSKSSKNEILSADERSNIPNAGPTAPSLSSPDVTNGKRQPEQTPHHRQKTLDRENKKTTVSSKGKSRSFWPFSRSNTSDESSRESNNTSDKLSSLESSSRLGSLDSDDTNSTHTMAPRGNAQHNSTTSNNLSAANNLHAASTIIPPSVGSATASVSGTATAVPPVSSADERSRQVSSSDELLKQSLAAMSEELDGCCSADLSNLSDLTEVADRTAKLASKTFSFKLGSK